MCFADIPLSRTPHIIKGIVIWVVRRQTVRRGGIFSQPALPFPVRITWCRVLLSDLGFSIPNLLDWGLAIKCKYEWSVTLPPPVTSPNAILWTRCLLNMNMNPSSDWHHHWNLRMVVSVVNGKQYCLLFPWFCFPHRKFPIDFSFVHRRQNM